MHRRHFLQLPIAAATVPFVLPSLADVGAADQKPPRKGFLVKAGEDWSGQPFKFLDATFTVKVSGKDTNGRCVIFDTLRPANVGPTLRMHTDCDEWFFVMDGEFKFQVGEEIRRLKAGDSLLMPQETPHTCIKTSEGVARLIVMHQPAGTMEAYFRTVSKLNNPSVEERRVLAERHRMKLIGPPLTPD